MKIVEVTEIKEENVVGMRIQCFWLFSITGMYHENKGSHFIFGFGITPMELSFQLTMWNFVNE